MLNSSLFDAIPGVLDVAAPRVAPICVVYDSPHSGVDLPAGFHPSVSADMVLKATDTHVDALFDNAPATGAPLLRALFPRSFLDVNRAESDVDVEMLDAPWPHPVLGSAAAKRGMGLAWRFAWGDTLMHDVPISVAEMEARIATYWQPYHQRVAALIDGVHAKFGQVYHVDCHSMPAFGHALSPDPAGTRRPDFVIGDFDGQTASPDFVAVVVDTLRAQGYEVALNNPFRGAELIRRYADPAKGRHSLQIEVNRALYMDEDTRARSGDFAAVKANLDRLTEEIAAFAKARMAAAV
ncbi:formiminoglutamase (plasmid) [Ketogulonicigenium robustum]|uniref:Formiminoglutamase n=1 Tax=Ketogulonicigenium robustum TaxID=92947 RepID=A0A1W6P361_9RHOB|nr:N-formylglutamate amidohydrolase [Ketogulonicigenium robustum]ARO15853.1 formiminoglutamase [Ketogulonicigenium robustum]